METLLDSFLVCLNAKSAPTLSGAKPDWSRYFRILLKSTGCNISALICASSTGKMSSLNLSKVLAVEQTQWEGDNSDLVVKSKYSVRAKQGTV